MTVQRVLIVFLPAFLMGCSLLGYPQLRSIPIATKPAIPTTKAGCDSAGGNWSQQGLGGGPFVCDLQTHDALKICTDSTQCEGACLVQVSIPEGQPGIGSCSSFVRTYGCHKFIQDGVVRGICAD